MRSVLPVPPLNQQLSACLLPFPGEAFLKNLPSLQQPHFFSVFWLKLASEKAGKSSRDKWQHSVNSCEQTPSKSKQLELSEDLKNAMPLPLPNIITFFMLTGHVWQEAHKDGFLPPPKHKYSIHFSQGLLTFSGSQKCFRIFFNWN